VDESTAQHPAGHGLWDSGHVVSVVRRPDEIDMSILGNGHYVGITVAGNPCGVLLCCSVSGTKALIDTLINGLDQITTSDSEPPPETGPC
jgi:hypothetical protein